jgi:hypothetical protein
LANLDELSPAYVRAQRFTLALRDPAIVPRVFGHIDVTIDYTRATPGGLVLPLELIVTPPTPGQAERRVFKRFAPPMVVVLPREPGGHLIVLREIYHNRWWGSLRVDVKEAS